MNHLSVRGCERTLEAHGGKAFDRAGNRGRDFSPGIRTGPRGRAGADRIEAETDIAGRRREPFALHIFGDMNGGHPRLRSDLKLNAYPCIEENAVENLFDRLR